MNDLQRLKAIQRWKRDNKLDKRDRKSTHKITYLVLDGCRFTIKHNKTTQTFIITSPRHSFEVKYYTRFRSFHIRENVEKYCNSTIMKKFNDDEHNVLHRQKNRMKLVEFLNNQF